MYSPKIKPELVRKLYVHSKGKQKPMTKIVNRIIQEYLEKEEKK